MSSSAPLTPRAQAKRLQILQAAERLFLEGGFAATSMDAITAAAGVSKQTVYSYFPNKEELFASVLRHLIEERTSAQLTETSSAAPLESREDLQRALTGLAQSLITNLMNPTYLAMIRIMFAELRRFPQLAGYFREAVPERVLTKVAALLEQAHAKELAAVWDLDAASRLFMGPLLVHVILDGLLVPDGPPRPPSPERITQLVAHFMQAIPPAKRGDEI